MINNGVTVTKFIKPQQLGKHNDKIVYICFGNFGYYLKHNEVTYSIPLWAQKENMPEMFKLYQAIKIIDWKMKKKKLSEKEWNEKKEYEEIYVDKKFKKYI